MSNILKYKKQIIVVCLLTFLFVPLHKPKDPKADVASAIVIGGVTFSSIPTGAIIAGVGLAVACGYVITHPEMIDDVGQKVFETVNSIPGALEVVGEKIKLNVNDFVLDKVIPLLESLPQEDTYILKDGSVLQSDLTNISSWTSSYSLPSGVYATSGSFTLIPRSCKYATTGAAEDQAYLSINFRGKTSKIIDDYYDIDVPVSISFDYSSTKAFLIVNGTQYTIDSASVPYNNIIYIGSAADYYNVRFDITDCYTFDSVCIPYTEDNGKNVSVDIPKTYFPSGTGSISVPTDYPLNNYNPSVDVPISKPSDLVLEDAGVVISSDTVTDDTVTDEGTGDSTGLWDWLKSLLNSIFELLQSILNVISNLVNALLDGISSLLEYLFVPTVVLDDLFSIPSGSGFESISNLFDLDKLWSIEPKPYRFKANWNYKDVTNSDLSFTEEVELKPFEVSIIDDNLSLIRNLLSYSTLIFVVLFIVYHFLPRREMD